MMSRFNKIKWLDEDLDIGCNEQDIERYFEENELIDDEPVKPSFKPVSKPSIKEKFIYQSQQGSKVRKRIFPFFLKNNYIGRTL